MLEFLIALVPLVLLIFKEFLSESARSKAEDRQFKLTQESFRAIVRSALDKQIAGMAKESAGQGKTWDAVDSQNGPGPEVKTTNVSNERK